ncbi:MAG: hypothetical protein ACK5BG_17945, partial [Pseudanabaena sp.]
MLGHTALCAQTQTKKIFESVAKQHFQKFSWFVLSIIAVNPKKERAASSAAISFLGLDFKIKSL